MATSTIDTTTVNDGLTGTDLVRQIKTQLAAAKTDIEGLTAASLAATVGATPGTGAAGAAATASKSDHVHPLQTETVVRPADAAANTATAETTVLCVKAASTLSAIKLCADGAVTADDTDYLTITVKKADGAGGASSTVAEATSKVTGGIAIAARTKVSLGSLTGPVLAAGSILTVAVAKAGSGKALPTHALIFEFV